ncbi:hypothetical protein LTV02_17935 [Nocardia yamanashiensis]|uniref:hypothetical protein n=1 Tax=Nocardia yamanashiensis TaxID=209247 RepID=UPI001E401A6F|nr:hypothetical protein [Nocardia yamanashiensis]UGT45152.1 hypothetical protein LTV02_17935 [Nocardia yamanashiensis]
MDPDKALDRIRDLVYDADRLRPQLDGNDAARVLYALTEVVEGLDRWLTDGGFPPEDWHWETSPEVSA